MAAKPSKGIPAVVMAVMALACLIIVSLVISAATSQPWDKRADSIGAYMHVKRVVEAKLTSPSTADFPLNPTTARCDIETQTYFIESYVDSQNGFGATVRTKFGAKLRQTGRGEWRIDDLAIE